MEDGLKSVLWDWYKQRATTIRQRVSAYEILRRNGVRLKQVSDSRAEQIQCPFHGKDDKPSARVYPDSADRSSHVWCYVCQKSWDAIGLQMQFSGGIKFAQALGELERAYGIETPPMPQGVERVAVQQQDPALADFQRLHDVCESRLRYALQAYKALDDLTGYIQCGSILDKLLHRVTRRKLAPGPASQVLQQLLAKIGKKVEQGDALLELPG